MKQRLIQDMDELELAEYFRSLGRTLTSLLPPGRPGSVAENGCLFLLLVDDGSGVAQYISNAQRRECIKFLRETAERLELREDVTR